MINLFGISGEYWSLIIQLLGFSVSFLIGILGCRQSLTLNTFLIGIFVNIIGQIIFAGGGPGAFVGIVFFPLICILFGHLGKGTRWLIWDRKKPGLECVKCNKVILNDSLNACPICGQPLRCQNCGYNLTGNVSGVCPECGEKI